MTGSHRVLAARDHPATLAERGRAEGLVEIMLDKLLILVPKLQTRAGKEAIGVAAQCMIALKQTIHNGGGPADLETSIAAIPALARPLPHEPLDHHGSAG